MLTKEECYEYWKNEVNDIQNKNNPYLYIGKPKTIINKLHNFWSTEISKVDSILEIGCNSGANLNHLRNLGYTNLCGIDINAVAIAKMKEAFPETYANSTIYIGSIEEILPSLPDKSVDVCFSVAVLEHIHPDVIYDVCKELKRVARKYIITCEDEAEILRHDRLFPRNYKVVFENTRCKQIKELHNTEIPPEYGAVYWTTDDGRINIIKNRFEYSTHTNRMFKII